MVSIPKWKGVAAAKVRKDKFKTKNNLLRPEEGRSVHERTTYRIHAFCLRKSIPCMRREVGGRGVFFFGGGGGHSASLYPPATGGEMISCHCLSNDCKQWVCGGRYCGKRHRVVE